MCNLDLQMADRQGIEIDYCLKCRGVWLDRGELDKIIERSVVAAPVAVMAERPDERHSTYHYDDDDDYHKKRKRKSFLGELLDF